MHRRITACRTVCTVQTHSRRVLYMQPHDFHFEITGRGSDLLEAALLRYAHLAQWVLQSQAEA